MGFSRTNDSVCTGLLCYLNDDVCDREKLESVFGPAETSCEWERGYNWEFSFKSDAGAFKVYDRWGSARLGIGCGEPEAFLAWLAGQLGCTVEDLQPYAPSVEEYTATVQAHYAIDAMMADLD